jgi:PAS domain S-box-containing protein
MLMIAVLKQSPLGTASYSTVNADLKQTMMTVMEITQAQSFSQEIIGLRNSLDQLREKENTAVEMISLEKWSAASDILFGDDYMLSKKTYEVDSEAAIGSVTGELVAAAQRFEQVKYAALGLRVGALILLVWVGVMFTRNTRSVLAEQMRLRDELFETYQEVEARVNQRTAELEKTTQRLAEENVERAKSDQRTRLILNSAGDGIFGVDAHERGVFFNDAALAMLGHSEQDLMGQEMHRIIHHKRADGTPLPEELCPMHLACVNGIARKVSDEVFWRQDGTAFASEYSVTPIDLHGDHSGAVVVFRDITEQRKNQQELQERMDELQRFNHLTMGREDRMIALKQEVNTLLQTQGLAKKYRSTDEGQL